MAIPFLSAPLTPHSLKAVHELKSAWVSVDSSCPSVVIDIPDIPDCDPQCEWLAPRALASGKVQCRVRRVRRGKLGGSISELYLEDGNVFQMCAVSSGGDWTIYTERNRGTGSALARLCRNGDGSFTLARQRGTNVVATSEMMFVTQGKHCIDGEETTINTMSVMLPNTNSSQRELSAGALSRRMQKANEHQPHVLTSKPPKFCAQTNAYQLAYHGRATLPSSRNFQLEDMEQGARIALLYGKMEADEFTLDYQHPLSMVQAFAASLSSWTW